MSNARFLATCRSLRDVNRFYLETRERSRSIEIFQTYVEQKKLSYVKNLCQTENLETLHGMIIMRIVDSYQITFIDDTEKVSDLCSMTNFYNMTVLELYDIYRTQRVRANKLIQGERRSGSDYELATFMKTKSE